MDQSHYQPPNDVDSTSSRLLVRLAEEDPEAWRQLVRLYGPVVRFWIRRAGLNKADLADVFQEVFIAVSRNIAGFHRQSGQAKFRAWLKTVTMSKVNDHFRRLGKQPVAFGGSTAMQRLDELPDRGDPSADGSESCGGNDLSLAGSEESFVAHRTLELVKGEFLERTWQAFYRTAVDGQTSQAVAEELGMKAAAVRRAKFRVLKRLRKELDADADGDTDPNPKAGK